MIIHLHRKHIRLFEFTKQHTLRTTISFDLNKNISRENIESGFAKMNTQRKFTASKAARNNTIVKNADFKL